MVSPRTIAAIWLAKASGGASRKLGRGGGTALAGLLGLSLQPALIRELTSKIGAGSVLISGTNGKTTTSLLIGEVARVGGYIPLANTSGSNLLRGVASTLASEVGAAGGMPNADRRLGVFEIDEANLAPLLRDLQPRAVVLLNLFRDQLDRYGEVDALTANWKAAVASLPPEVRLVLNADDPAVASLGEDRSETAYFGIEDDGAGSAVTEHASDSLNCRCGARLSYESVYFSHLGNWRCPACRRSRPRPSTAASDIELNPGGASFLLRSGAEEVRVSLSLAGLYNVYNGVAAAAAARSLDLTLDDAHRGLALATAAFGRQESFEIDARRIDVLLGKNPAGLNQVLATLAVPGDRRPVLLALNDGIADGRDVSWIWDVDFEKYTASFRPVFLSGERAAELALRLKYAGWDEGTLTVEPDLALALKGAIEGLPSGSRLSVVPTYTAMLEVREMLSRRSGGQPYWRGR